jgi:uncharacterized protein (TIGR00251 family)
LSFEIRTAAGAVSFAVRVQPGAKREEVVGYHADAIKLAIRAPALDGKANDVMIRYLAELLHVPRLSVEILSGALARSKVVRITGVTAEEVRSKITPSETA